MIGCGRIGGGSIDDCNANLSSRRKVEGIFFKKIKSFNYLEFYAGTLLSITLNQIGGTKDNNIEPG